MKLVGVIRRDVIPKCPQESKAAKTRLEIFLDTCERQQGVPVYEWRELQSR